MPIRLLESQPVASPLQFATTTTMLTASFSGIFHSFGRGDSREERTPGASDDPAGEDAAGNGFGFGSTRR